MAKESGLGGVPGFLEGEAALGTLVVVGVDQALAARAILMGGWNGGGTDEALLRSCRPGTVCWLPDHVFSPMGCWAVVVFNGPVVPTTFAL